jgi:transposase
MSTWAWRAVSDSTFDRVVTLANDGLSQSEIAIELELNRSTVLRAWRKADDAGLLETKATTKGRNQYQKRSKGE